jgi:TolA-binding protein
MKLLKCLLVIYLLLNSILLFAEISEKPLNLKKIADDMKFRNGIAFIKLERPEKAMQELSEYLEIFQDGIHRDEAYKKIARIYMNNFEYLKAIRIFISLYEEFSINDEGIEGYFMAGICYKKIGYENKAVKIFNHIIKEYPHSTFARRARLQVDLLKIINID